MWTHLLSLAASVNPLTIVLYVSAVREVQVRIVLSRFDSDKMKETFSGFKRRSSHLFPHVVFMYIQMSRKH